MEKNKKRKKSSAVLTGLLAFAMTTSYFYLPNGMKENNELVEAAATVGQTRTFNNTGTGATGGATNNSSGTLSGNITITGGIYYWTVPQTAVYTIDAYGAQGGQAYGSSNAGYYGAKIQGDVTLYEGQVIKILVGQQGLSGLKVTENNNGGGGGGGTFVTTKNNMPLIVAGGGAGVSYGSYNATYGAASTTTIAKSSAGGVAGGATGSGGSAGSSTGYYTSCAGAGFYGNGAPFGSCIDAKSFVNGGTGGTSTHATKDGIGGFGGGGMGHLEGGGGGGYSGGAASTHGWSIAGGGGSYNSGMNQSNTVGTKTGHGQVIIKVKSLVDNSAAVTYTYNLSKTFNNTSTGNAGANTNNSSGTLDGTVSMSGGMYLWTVPETGMYSIEAKGAKGADGLYNSITYKGGKGAKVKGTFFLAKGEQLKILVGQQGVYDVNAYCSAGGGGTFVTTTNNLPLVVAGGGGGTATGANGGGGKLFEVTTGNGGTGAASGAGLIGNGSVDSWVNPGAKSFVNGGTGGGKGYYNNYGGFGGGANTHGNCGTTYVGGGGYSGGNSGQVNNGGYSYNGGTNQANTAAYNDGQGQTIITYVSPTVTQSPAKGTKFQNNYVDVSWAVNKETVTTVSRYEIQAGTTSGGTNFVPLTNKGTGTSHRITVPAGTAGNTTIYWRVRVIDSEGYIGPWKESTVIYSNNVPTITATTNVPAKLDVSLEKRNHGFSINSLKDSDDFNYVTLFADVLDGSGNVISGSKKQIVLDSSLVPTKLISGTGTEKDGSLQGPFNHTTPFNLKISLQPDFTTGKFDLTLTKADGVTNVVKSGQKLLTGRTMQATSATSPESYKLRIYPEDRQNTNALSANPLAGISDVAPITIPFTSDTRNYLPNLTNVKHDVAKRMFSDAEGFNRISVTGHVDDSDPADKVTMYYEVQPKASNYAIQVKTVSGKVVPKSGISTQTFSPKVNNDFAFTYQIDPNLDSGNYALLVYGYDTQEGLGDYYEIPFTVDRGAPTIDFVADYTVSGKTIKMSSAQKQVVAEDNKVKLYFTPNNYATFEYAGYLIRGGQVKDLRIRGAFTNQVKASFIGVNLGQDPITLLDGATTDFKLNDVIVFKFKATSATGIKTTKDVRILIGDDASNFTPLDDAKIPTLP